MIDKKERKHLDSNIKQAVLDFLYSTGRMQIGLTGYMRGVTHTTASLILSHIEHQEEKK